MNKVILKGRLTRDIEIAYSNSANPVSYTNFSVAVNRIKDGVDFINCTAFSKTAELLANYFRKGQEILIEGRIQVDTGEKEDGTKITYTKVMVERVEFCGSKQQQGDAQEPSGTHGAFTPNVPDEDDALPF